MNRLSKLTIAAIGLPLFSLLTFYLYGKWHWDLVRALDEKAETLLTWSLIDGLKIVSVLLALAGLAALIGAAFTEKKRKLLVLPVGLSIVALMTVPVIT